MKLLYTLVVLASVGLCSSCANVINVAPQVNGLAIAGRFDQALNVLSDPSQYGANNQLLYLLDKGLVEHLAGHYEESIDTFEEAKLEYDRLYTQSISKITASWLWNDYALPYRGEDFERVMVNIFQAVNFAVLDNIPEALVEARDVDSILNAINAQYSNEQKNVYREDAFARLFMGLLYEADGNLNDALISYRSAWKIYQNDYSKNYSISPPLILKQNLLAAAQEFGDFDLAEYRRAFSGIEFLSWDKKKSKGEIIVVEYAGISPLKLPEQIAVPLPGGYVSQIVFPKYQNRSLNLSLTQVSLSDGQTAECQLAEDVSAIAIKNLKDRKIRVMAKAVLRPAGKYLLERTLEQSVEKDHGKRAAAAVKYAGSLYNLISERPDLRSWQTLPAQIRIARFFVEPGEYEISAGTKNLGSVELKAGKKKFLMMRTLP